MSHLAGQPVHPSMPPAPPSHWERVAASLQLTPAQVAQVMQLNALRLQWTASAHQVRRTRLSHAAPAAPHALVPPCRAAHNRGHQRRRSWLCCSQDVAVVGQMLADLLAREAHSPSSPGKVRIA